MNKTKIAKILAQINVLMFIIVILLLVAMTKIAKADDSIKVMVMDTGVDSRHPRLSKYIEQPNLASDFFTKILDYLINNNIPIQNKYLGLNMQNTKDFNGHGTHVTGTILYGEMSPSDLDGIPVCKQVKIIPCKYHGNNINELSASVACLRLAADLKVHFINYSGGGDKPSVLEFRAIKQLELMGTKIIAATGNDGRDLSKYPYYPASYNVKNVIKVGSVDKDNNRLPTSNYGDGVVYEKGKNIYSTMPNGKYGYMTGTSMAAPMHLHKLLIDRCKELNNNDKK